MIKQHKHTWLWWDWMKISWNNIKNKGGKQFYTTYRLKTSGEWSWDIKITTWFKPKRVFINAIYINWFIAQSDSHIVDNDWVLTVTTYYQKYNFRERWTRWSGSNSSVECIYIERDASRRQHLFMKSFDEDWFTLEYWTNWTNDVWIHILAIS